MKAAADWWVSRPTAELREIRDWVGFILTIQADVYRAGQVYMRDRGAEACTSRTCRDAIRALEIEEMS